MKLCNFSNTDYHVGWYKNKWAGLVDFIKSNQLDGIELLLHGNENISEIPKDLVKGLHLSYFPTWLEFYNDGDYSEDFPDESSLKRAFGGTDKYAIHDRFIRDFRVAKDLGVHYMVYHVGHVTIREAYSFDFSYNNKDVLQSALEIVNDVFVGDGPELLFENLWWPGLTLLDKEELDWFMSQVNYQNKGIMLDLSHLLITNPRLKDLDEGIDYLISTIKNLGDSKKWIKGIHINGTDVYDYLKKDHTDSYETYINADDNERFMEIYRHISAMDQHKPLKHSRLPELIALIKPKYEMIEVVGQDKNMWESYVVEQLKVMNDL